MARKRFKFLNDVICQRHHKCVTENFSKAIFGIFCLKFKIWGGLNFFCLRKPFVKSKWEEVGIWSQISLPWLHPCQYLTIFLKPSKIVNINKINSETDTCLSEKTTRTFFYNFLWTEGGMDVKNDFYTIETQREKEWERHT